MTRLNNLMRRTTLAASVFALVAMAGAVPLKTALADSDNWQRHHDWQHNDNRDHDWGRYHNHYVDQRPGFYYAQPQPYYQQPVYPQPGVSVQLNLQ